MPAIRYFVVVCQLLLLGIIQPAHGQMVTKASDAVLLKRIKSEQSMVAVWDFHEKAGKKRRALGMGNFPLTESNGKIERINEGPLSGYCALMDGSHYFNLPHEKTGALNISGKGAGVTVMAWVKWTGEQVGFVGGMWNEYEDGGKRQYGLFVSLPYYNGRDQVCGHISSTGKPTPPFPYSIDYSASKQVVPKNEWCSVAFTYDGEFIKSYLNGKFESRDPERISNTSGFEGYPNGLVQSKNPYYFADGIGDNGSDFTVGAVLLRRGMGNFFKGLIGGLAVFNRALTDHEIHHLLTGGTVPEAD